MLKKAESASGNRLYLKTEHLQPVSELVVGDPAESNN